MSRFAGEVLESLVRDGMAPGEAAAAMAQSREAMKVLIENDRARLQGDDGMGYLVIPGDPGELPGFRLNLVQEGLLPAQPPGNAPRGAIQLPNGMTVLEAVRLGLLR